MVLADPMQSISMSLGYKSTLFDFMGRVGNLKVFFNPFAEVSQDAVEVCEWLDFINHQLVSRAKGLPFPDALHQSHLVRCEGLIELLEDLKQAAEHVSDIPDERIQGWEIWAEQEETQEAWKDFNKLTWAELDILIATQYIIECVLPLVLVWHSDT